MLKVTDELFSVDRDVDLVYSPDDGGWYLQLFLHDEAGNTKTSHAMFATKRKAVERYNAGKIVWED